jgi:hypothetical protein
MENLRADTLSPNTVWPALADFEHDYIEEAGSKVHSYKMPPLSARVLTATSHQSARNAAGLICSARRPEPPHAQESASGKPNLAKVLLKGVSRNTILAAVEQVDVDMSMNHTTSDTHILPWLAHNPVKDEMQGFYAGLSRLLRSRPIMIAPAIRCSLPCPRKLWKPSRGLTMKFWRSTPDRSCMPLRMARKIKQNQSQPSKRQR